MEIPRSMSSVHQWLDLMLFFQEAPAGCEIPPQWLLSFSNRCPHLAMAAKSVSVCGNLYIGFYGAIKMVSGAQVSHQLHFSPTMDTLTSSTSFLPVHDIQAHVPLMKSFRKLQDDLQPGGIPFNQQSGVPLPSSSTISFVQRAVQRFGVWLSFLGGSGDVLSHFQKHIPPLDVLMVWYAYMLSPGTYYEDSRNTAPRYLGWHALE